MKKTIPIICLLPLIIVALFCEARGATDDEESFYEQLTRAIVRLEEHQSICKPGLDRSIERDLPVGTAFFVHDKNKSNSKFFIITARHVVENRADLFARVKIDNKSNKYVILNLPRELWVFNPSPTPGEYLPVDVALMQIPPAEFIKTFLYCEKNEDCGKDRENKLQNQLKESPNVMDRAIFFGFPGGDVAKESLEPFARTGVVAYTAFNPDVRIDGKPVPEDSIYYVDSPAFPGNSGGPVLREPLPPGAGGVFLLGLVTGTNIVGRDYTIVTRPEKIEQTIHHARTISKMSASAWRETIPELPLKCGPDNIQTRDTQGP